VSDGRGSVVYCGRELAMDIGPADELSFDLVAVRDDAHEELSASIHVQTRSNDMQLANNHARHLVKIVGKPSRFRIFPPND
jgi:hypothetical protein